MRIVTIIAPAARLLLLTVNLFALDGSLCETSSAASNALLAQAACGGWTVRVARHPRGGWKALARQLS